MFLSVFFSSEIHPQNEYTRCGGHFLHASQLLLQPEVPENGFAWDSEHKLFQKCFSLWLVSDETQERILSSSDASSSSSSSASKWASSVLTAEGVNQARLSFHLKRSFSLPIFQSDVWNILFLYSYVLKKVSSSYNIRNSTFCSHSSQKPIQRRCRSLDVAPSKRQKT